MAKYAVILDLDGTLAYTMDDITTAVNNMLTRLGYKTRTKAEVLKFINNGARQLVRLALPKSVQEMELIVDTALATYEEEYAKCYLEKTHAYEGIVEALVELKKETNVSLAVLSNKQDKFVKDIIAKLFPEKLFKVVMGQAGMPTKPDPTSTLHILKKLGVKPTRAFLVGDSDIDVQTAINAGITPIGVEWGYRDSLLLRKTGAEYIAESPEQIYEILSPLVRKEKK